MQASSKLMAPWSLLAPAMRSENGKTPRTSLPLPYNIMAGDMNATVLKQDVQRVNLDISDANLQELIKSDFAAVCVPSPTATER